MYDIPTCNAGENISYGNGDFGDLLMAWKRWFTFKRVQLELNGYGYGDTGDLPEFRWNEMSLILVRGQSVNFQIANMLSVS